MHQVFVQKLQEIELYIIGNSLKKKVLNNIILDFVGDLGSGYPSDPETKKWLQNNKHKIFGFPSLIRFSWNTCSNILDDFCALTIDK